MVKNPAIEEVYEILGQVSDPEIPVLTIQDLGIIRDVRFLDQGVEVVITPTYSGCPAMNEIEAEIKSSLEDNGFWPVTVTTVLSPAWTTAWMSEEGKQKLLAYGIAPPQDSSRIETLMGRDTPKSCPNCGSERTILISQFGSTACKSLYKCEECLEPFDYFKCH